MDARLSPLVEHVLVPVVVMERKADAVAFTDAVIGDQVAALDALFTVR